MGSEMASQRLSMRKSREILRRKYELQQSHRDVARSLNVGVGTIGATLKRARGLSAWKDVAGLSEAELEARLYDADPRTGRPAPDCVAIHTERQRRGALVHKWRCGNEYATSRSLLRHQLRRIQAFREQSSCSRCCRR